MAEYKQQKALSSLEISAFCSQMAMILRSGISTIEGITILYNDASGPAEKSLLEQIKTQLEESGSLSQALASSGVFPDYLITMTKIGEQTGTLDEVMKSLTAHYNREDNINRSIKNALFYPLIMIFMMVVVIAILLIKVIPIFNQMFIQLGREMTGVSKGVLTLGNTLSKYSTALVIGIAVLFILLILLAATKKGRRLVMRVCYRLAIFRHLYDKIAALRFASGVTLTLSSGMNPEQSIELAAELNNNPYFQQKIDRCISLISTGSSFSDALSAAGIFSGIYAKMTAVAAKTGTTDEVMQQLADQYEAEVDNRISGIIAAIEPTLVIILSLIVGIILLSVMLPLMGVMSAL